MSRLYSLLFSSNSKLCNSYSVGVVDLSVNITSYNNFNVSDIGSLGWKVVGVEGLFGGLECSIVIIVAGVIGE